MKHAPAFVLSCVLMLILGSCGGGETIAFGDILVLGVPDNVEACQATQVNIQGDNFLSEHGTAIDVIFAAVEGTPFNGGTQSEVTVQGTVIDDSTIQVTTPVAQADVQVTVTVVLPGGASGSSTPGALLLSGGQQQPPQAVNDGYTAVGNVLLTVTLDESVLDNDIVGGCLDERAESNAITAPGSNTTMDGLTVVAFDQASANGGQVNVNADGSFTYNPPVGFEGSDTFTYTMQTPGGVQDTATVTINVADVVWFIDSSAAGGGDGRLTGPFNDVNQFLAIQGNGGPTDAEVQDYIFFYAGNQTPYVATIPLLDDQQVRGEAEDLVVNGRTIVTAGMRPILSTILQIGEGGEPIIQLANRNTIRGVELNGSEGPGIRGFDSAGPVLVDNVRIINVDTAFDVSGNISGTYTLGNNQAQGGVYVTNCFQVASLFDFDASEATLELLGVIAGNCFRGGFTSGVSGTFDNCAFGFDDQGGAAGFDDDGFIWENGGGPRTLTIDNCTFSNLDDQGLDLNTFDASPATVSINNTTIAADEECIDIFDSNQGQVTFSLSNLTLTTNDTGVDTVNVRGQLNGTTCNGFDSITVNGTGAGLAGGGITMDRVTFDADTNTAGIQQVMGTNIQIGTSATARVEGDGLRLTDPSGDLSINPIGIFNDSGTGLFVDTKISATTFNLAIGGGSVNTTNGASQFLDPPVGAPPLQVDIRLAHVSSTNSPTHGVEFDNVAGRVVIEKLDVRGASKAPVVQRNSPNLEVEVPATAK